MATQWAAVRLPVSLKERLVALSAFYSDDDQLSQDIRSDSAFRDLREDHQTFPVWVGIELAVRREEKARQRSFANWARQNTDAEQVTLSIPTSDAA